MRNVLKSIAIYQCAKPSPTGLVNRIPKAEGSLHTTVHLTPEPPGLCWFWHLYFHSAPSLLLCGHKNHRSLPEASKANEANEMEYFLN